MGSSTGDSWGGTGAGGLVVYIVISIRVFDLLGRDRSDAVIILTIIRGKLTFRLGKNDSFRGGCCCDDHTWQPCSQWFPTIILIRY